MYSNRFDAYAVRYIDARDSSVYTYTLCKLSVLNGRRLLGILLGVCYDTLVSRENTFVLFCGNLLPSPKGHQIAFFLCVSVYFGSVVVCFLIFDCNKNWFILY